MKESRLNMNEKELRFKLNPFDIISLISKYRKEIGLTLSKLSKLTIQVNLL